jgi:hypothetical protein
LQLKDEAQVTVDPDGHPFAEIGRWNSSHVR